MDSTGIANLALGRLGIGTTIGALTDRTVEAQACNRFFNQCRQEVLRAHPWGFAQSAVALALVAAQTFPGWTYVYAMPDGAITVRAVSDESGLRTIRDVFLTEGNVEPLLQRMRIPFQIALKADGASQVILTDVTSAWAFCTMDVPNTGSWPVDFSSVVAWRLAMEAGGPLRCKREFVDAAEQRYLMWFSHAAANNMNEQKDDVRPESPSISCRM